MVRFGTHVDVDRAVSQAGELGVTAVQVFLGDPQSWRKPAVEGGLDALGHDLAAADLFTVVHAPYIINVASLNNRIRIPSRKLLQQTVDAAHQVGAGCVVVHGGHVRAGEDDETGFDNWRKCIDGLNPTVPVLIENTAGGDHAMARHLERIARLWDAISTADGFDNVGFCLDTCHAHAAGEELHGLVERVLAVTGRIDLVHLNDSRDAFGSGADRHASIGAGHADLDGLAEVARTANAPIILETPIEGREADLAWLRGVLA